MNQKDVFAHIKDLTEEEQTLYSKENLSKAELKKKDEIQKELDRYFDLLRQRRALREFGEDPDNAKVRNSDTVENYKQ